MIETDCTLGCPLNGLDSSQDKKVAMFLAGQFIELTDQNISVISTENIRRAFTPPLCEVHVNAVVLCLISNLGFMRESEGGKYIVNQ